MAIAGSKRPSSRRRASRCAAWRSVAAHLRARLHVVLDPIRLGVSVPQAAALLASERPAVIFTTGGYVAIPVLMAAAPLRIPVVMWDGNVHPRALGPGDGPSGHGPRRLVRGDLRRAPRRGAGVPCYLTGTPIRDTRDVDREAARARLGVPAGERVLLVFGGSQAVRRFNAAVAGALGAARRARHGHPCDRRRRLRRGARGPGGACRPTCAPATGRIRSCATTCSPRSPTADLVVGRAGSSTLAEVTALGVPMIVVPYPHAAGHQRANARVLVDAGPPG